MLRTMALLFAIFFIGMGVAGFLPSYHTNNLLFGYFAVDTVHSIAYLVTGGFGLIATTSYQTAKFYFQFFGVLFAVITILGFTRNGDLYLLSINMADNILHLIITIIAFYFGFFVNKVHA